MGSGKTCKASGYLPCFTGGQFDAFHALRYPGTASAAHLVCLQLHED